MGKTKKAATGQALRPRKATRAGVSMMGNRKEITDRDTLRNRLYQRRFYLKRRISKVEGGEAVEVNTNTAYSLETLQAELDEVNATIARYSGKGPGRPKSKKTAKK